MKRRRNEERGRGAPRGQRLKTACFNAWVLGERAKGRSQTEIARQLADGNEHRLGSKKQHVQRAAVGGIEIPADGKRIVELLEAIAADVSEGASVSVRRK